MGPSLATSGINRYPEGRATQFQEQSGADEQAAVQGSLYAAREVVLLPHSCIHKTGWPPCCLQTLHMTIIRDGSLAHHRSISAVLIACEAAWSQA
jgi:hypothetical protein